MRVSVWRRIHIKAWQRLNEGKQELSLADTSLYAEEIENSTTTGREAGLFPNGAAALDWARTQETSRLHSNRDFLPSTKGLMEINLTIRPGEIVRGDAHFKTYISRDGFGLPENIRIFQMRTRIRLGGHFSHVEKLLYLSWSGWRFLSHWAAVLNVQEYPKMQQMISD